MTLNEAANFTKRALAYLLLFIVLYMLGEYLIRGSNFIYDRFFPKPTNPPTISFGKIDIVDIPTLPVDLSSVEYRLELPTSSFPTLPESVRVYEITQPRISVAKEEKFIQIANDLQFSGTPMKVSDTERLWKDIVNRREFRSNIFYETFNQQTNSSYLEAHTITGSTPSKVKAVDTAKEYFKTTQVLNDDLQLAEYYVEGVEIIEGVRKQTLIPQKEQLKFVNVFPKKVLYVTLSEPNRKGKRTETPNYATVLFSNPVISNVNLFVGLLDKNEAVTDSFYNYFSTTGNYGTYPIITPQTAYNLLIQNKASLVFIREDGADYFAPSNSVSNISTIDIRSIELAYYMPTNIVDYLQPIYVFRGKYTTSDRKVGDVVYYLPAIDPSIDKN